MLERRAKAIIHIAKIFVFAAAILGFGNVAAAAIQTTRPSIRVASSNAATTDFIRTVSQAKALMSRNPEQVVRIVQRAKTALIEQKKDRQLALKVAQLDWLEAEADLRLNNPTEAGPLIHRGMAVVTRIAPNSRLMGELLISKGYLDTLSAKVASALDSFHQAYRIFQLNGDVRNQAIVLQSIATLYREANDLQSALKYDAQSSELYLGDKSLSVSMHNNYGNTLFHLKRYAEAKKQYELALISAKSLDSALLQVRILGNLARAQVALGDDAGATASLADGFKSAQQPVARAWQSQLLAIAAELAWSQHNLARAKHFIDRSFAEDTESSGMISDRDAHETAYKIYKKIGDTAVALKHLEALKHLDDETATLAASANNALMAARFDYTNQNLKIAKLQAEDLQRKIAYERAHARTVRLAFISAGGVTVVVIAMLVFGIVVIRRSRNEERAAKDALADTNTALARALAAKTEFLATTSHEIRTPLNGILGMTQVMLADAALPDSYRDRLDLVHAAGTTMRALVDDILDVAKIETGNMTIEHAPMDVCAVLRDVARIWEDQAQARGLEFTVSLDDCPTIVVGDAARLRQIVFNLLSNALKFTERGGIHLSGTRRSSPRGDRMFIEVRDTGIGIPADKADEIFESFRQADTSTTRRFGGTGLGLAICRNLARAMGGDVHVTSQPGLGATFTIDLPLIEGAQPMTVAEADCATNDMLLIVDRNPITRSMLRALVEECAPTIRFASGLGDAADQVASGGIGRVLIDEATVRATGPEWLKALRHLTAAADDRARTILLWREPEGAEALGLFASGLDAIIETPVSPLVLRETLLATDATSRRDTEQTRLVSSAA